MNYDESSPNLEAEEGQVAIGETAANILNILVSRRWTVFTTFLMVISATAGALLIIPNRYTSEATILVRQQQVPERYVVPTSTTDVSKALQAMREQVLSRSRLLPIIHDLGLYPKHRDKMAPEALVEMMRGDISIVPLENNPESHEINALRISYTGDSPAVAQSVTSRLTTLFVQENLKIREDQAAVTTNFLEEQLESVKTKLTAEEQMLRDFKMQFIGELPEQQRGNLEILAGLQGQLQNVNAALSRAQQQKLYLDSLLRAQRKTAPSRVAVITPEGPKLVSPVEQATHELEKLETAKKDLLIKYSPIHPDVQTKEREIARAKADLAAVKRQTESQVAAAPSTEAVPDADSEDAAVAQLRSQQKANSLEIDDLQKMQQRLGTEITTYSDRINKTPIREQQLSGVLRDYELLKQNYADLRRKKIESQLAATMEKRQEGQRFQLMDAPNLPAMPSSPKRPKIIVGGIAVGLILGIAAGFLREAFAKPPHTEKDCTKLAPAAFVIGIPAITSPRERIWRRIALAGEAVSAAVLLAAATVANVQALYLNH